MSKKMFGKEWCEKWRNILSIPTISEYIYESKRYESNRYKYEKESNIKRPKKMFGKEWCEKWRNILSIPTISECGYESKFILIFILVLMLLCFRV